MAAAVPNSCVGSIYGATLQLAGSKNVSSPAVSFDLADGKPNSPPQNVFRFSNLGLTTGNANGAKVCFNLRAPCSSMQVRAAAGAGGRGRDGGSTASLHVQQPCIVRP